jgi:ABC-type lipoprotein release transport system permease subunit
MDATYMVLRAELRRRWRSWLVLALLVGVVGGIVLGAAAAGRRTASAFPRFVSAHGYDYMIFNAVGPVPGVAHFPGVASVVTAPAPMNGNMTCSCGHALSGNNLTILELTSRQLAKATKLVAGRMPDPSHPDEVLVSFNFAKDDGIHIGDTIGTPFFEPSQLQAALNDPNVMPAGPVRRLVVVGIEASEGEFPAGNGPAYDMYLTTAFSRVGPPVLAANQYFVTLRHGAADLPRFTAAVTTANPYYAQNMDAIASAVGSSIHPQAVGWWVLAALTGLVGLLVVGQALGRQSLVESEEYPTLVALGVARRRLIALATLRNLAVAVVGVLVALALAYFLSPVTPVGEARLAEPSTGLAFDPVVLPLGALAIVAVVMLLGLWPSWRASQVRLGDDRIVEHRPSAIVARVAEAGAPPSVLIGVRHALERGRGAASVPVGSALFGTSIAVLALCATAIFGSSLAHLTTTPALYGDDYQVLFGNGGTGGDPAAELAAMQGAHTFDRIMVGTRQEVSVNGVSVYGLAGKAVRGPLMLSVVRGRLPAGDGDVILGATTMRQVGARLGSSVRVTFQLPDGSTRTVPFRVVGVASFPGQFGLGGLGVGAAFTWSAYAHADCPPGSAPAACEQAFAAGPPPAVMASATPDAAGRVALSRLVRQFGSSVAQAPTTPTSLVNFGEAVNFPLILGVALALFGAATLLHLLVVSSMRRRREIGLLKALGFVNRQVGAATCWQATTVVVVGLLVGIPLGVVVGRAVWNAFASNLGAVPVATVPLGLIAVIGAGILVVANLLALAPAMMAARTTSAEQLGRAE